MLFEAKIISLTMGNRIWQFEAENHDMATKIARREVINGRLEYVKSIKGIPVKAVFAPPGLDVSRFEDTASVEAESDIEPELRQVIGKRRRKNGRV